MKKKYKALRRLLGIWLTIQLCSPLLDLTANDNIRTASNLQRAGLTDEWFTQIDVGVRSKIVNMQLQVNEDLTTRYYLVEYNNVVERISQFDLDAFGNQRGIEGAEEFALLRKQIIEAELAAQNRTDVTVKVRPITLPQTTIYAATSKGKVTAIDADTGNQRWQTTIGNPRFITSGVGASKDYVAVVNGSTVFCLSAEKGKLIWSRQCHRSPSAAPSVGTDNIYVPLINGRLEVFAIDQSSLPRSFVSFGKSVSKPLLTDTTVSWATSDGFYAVAPYDARTIQFRLNSGSHFKSGGVAKNGLIYVSTTGGSIFALDEKTGGIIWEYSTGDHINSSPFIKGDSVYVLSAENRLYKFDTKRGRPAAGWEKPVEGVSQFISNSRDRIYVLDFIGQIVAIDPATGTKLSSVTGTGVDLVIPNSDTDRLYVGTQKGLIRCFRETGNTYPIFHANDQELVTDPNQVEAGSGSLDADTTDPSPLPDESDPFAGADDPFASEDNSSDEQTSTDEMDDPFADPDSDDPFAAGDEDDSSEKDDTTDPFGSDNGSDDDEDPFGDVDDDDDDPFGG